MIRVPNDSSSDFDAMLPLLTPETSSATTLQHQWIHDSQELEQIREDWTRLLKSVDCQSVFMTPEWTLVWWKHFGNKSRMAVLAVRDASEQLVGLAPFYISTHQFGWRRLAFLADSHVGSDYLSILAARGSESAVAATVVASIDGQRKAWDYIELRDTADSPLMKDFSERLKKITEDSERFVASTCYYIPLLGTFEDYMATSSSRVWRDYRKCWKALTTKHAGSLQVYSSVETLSDVFQEFLRLHELRFQSRGERSAILQPGVPSFQKEAALALAESGVARIVLVKAGDQSIAALYGFAVGEGFQYYQAGMDPSWDHLSPGKLVLAGTIQYLISAGQKEFDFLQGAEPYKADWAQHKRHTFTERYFDSRPRSQMARLSLRARAMASRWKAAIIMKRRKADE